MKMRLKLSLFFSTINIFIVKAEWIELPQFSDERKVYKVPANQRQFPYEKFQNNPYEILANEDPITVGWSLFDDLGTGKSTEPSSSNNEEDSWNADREKSSNQTIECDKINEDDDGIGIEGFPIELSTVGTLNILEVPTESSRDSTTTQVPTSTATGGEYFSGGNNASENKANKDLKFEDYLPMGMLKKVHRTLKSQPRTIEGKIRFFKQFEKSLITEIESRLNEALAPPRRTRGAHDYYDHDDEIGFPSLEGALMAISFLTFAVYLIRLVMLLFRTTTAATTSAAIYYGRQKRSPDEDLANKTEEILRQLNTFDAN